MRPRSFGQILFALALLIMNTVYFSQILHMSRPFAKGEPGPAFLPGMLCVFVYFASLSILVSEVRKPAAVAVDKVPGSDHVPKIEIVGPAIAIGLTVLFIIGFLYVGYLLSALLYATLVSLYFNYEQNGDKWRALLLGLVTGICVTLFGWLFFVKLFALYLPLWEL